jgi:uncharacterized membrane protein
MDIQLMLLVFGAAGSGLIGGLFFAFSNFIMRAFDRLPPGQAISAMQSINVTVLNPLFFACFFGTALISAALLAIACYRGDALGLVMGAGALLYLFGSIAVTMLFNVPLNNQLASAPMATPTMVLTWKHYQSSWILWNHVRTTASLLAALAFIRAIAMR